ncbi:Retrovirus-related pol Polyprotein [Phytophthora megakarya]|uniref:Retrovirus-related pol Polyprotein n=1 Tax=Phytophthora megakarya TaxID=4795 RepID=A0A225WFJ7_9STRA|nr:Retrovirus-related pol Polyprotein [Phytophthora megakarya]
MHMASDCRYFTKYTAFNKDIDCGRGFKMKFAANPVGQGTVQIIVKRGYLDVVLMVRDVFHVPDSTNVLSHSQAKAKCYMIEYLGRLGKNMYEIWKGKDKLLGVGRDKYGLFLFAAENKFLVSKPDYKKQNAVQAPKAPPQAWHERLSHLGPQFVKIIIDRYLVEGMIPRQRSFEECEAYHIGKERKASAKKTLEREIKRKNPVVFANLLFPEAKKSTGTQKPVLVIIDGYTRYTTVYLLISKEVPEVNLTRQRYIELADRQFTVKKVITDGGGEFPNGTMNAWYRKK